jgi:tyrosinase
MLDTDWASFSDRLESYHDDVHVWVGGDMTNITTAAFDPIFYAHHCMIDRIWYLWQVKHGNGGIPQALLNLPLEPFGKTFRDVLDVQALGYEYGSAATPINVAGGPQ